MTCPQAALRTLLVTALLVACGGGAPEPAPAPAAAPEPPIDRLTLLREAQARTHAEREKRRDALRAAGTATVTQKDKIGKKKEDVKLEITFEFKNLGDKVIDMADGAVEFRDGQDKVLKSLRVPFQGPIKPGDKTQKHGKFPVDAGEDGDVALVRTPLSELKVVWMPKLYKFSDGSDLVAE